jgi:hypothetical protein
MSIDLSTPQGVQQFIDTYSTVRGRRLANRLGLAGKGSQRLANAVSSFVWNAQAIKYCNSCKACESCYAGICEDALKTARSCDQFFSLHYAGIDLPSLQAWSKVSRKFIRQPAAANPVSTQDGHEIHRTIPPISLPSQVGTDQAGLWPFCRLT